MFESHFIVRFLCYVATPWAYKFGVNLPNIKLQFDYRNIGVHILDTTPYFFCTQTISSMYIIVICLIRNGYVSNFSVFGYLNINRYYIILCYIYITHINNSQLNSYFINVLLMFSATFYIGFDGRNPAFYWLC